MANDVKIHLAVEGAATAQDQFSRLDARLDTLNGTLVKTAHYGTALAGAFGLVLPALSNTVRATIGAADAVTTLKNQLKLATGGAAEAGQAYTALFDIAQKSRVSFTELGTTFASISRAGQEMGISQARLLAVTQSIGNAMAISGGSAQGMQAALTQLGQGLSSGILRGEELNSVMEQSPRLAKALADGLGVPLGELRKLGETGQLTSEQVIVALEKAGPQLAKEIETSVMTVGQAMTVLGNAATKFVGEMDQATNASSKLAAGIKGIASAVEVASAKGSVSFWTSDFKAAGEAMDRAKLQGAGFFGQMNQSAGMLIGRAAGLGFINRDFMTLSAAVADATATLKRLDDQEQRDGKLSVYSMGERATAARDLARANRELAQSKNETVVSNTQQGIEASGKAREKYLASHAKDQAALDALRNNVDKVPASYLKDMQEIIRLNQAGVLVGKDYTDMLAKQQKELLKKDDATKSGVATVTEAAKGLTLYNDLLDQASGYAASYAEDQHKLAAAFKSGLIPAYADYSKAVQALINKQPFMVKAHADEEKALEESAKAQEAARNQLAKHYDALAKGLISQQESTDKLREQVAEIGLTAEALGRLSLARMDAAIAQEQEAMTMMSAHEASAGELLMLQKRIDLLKEQRGLSALGTVRQAEAGTDPVPKSLKDVAAYMDPSKAKSFGDALKDAFGSAGDALAKLSNSFEGYIQKNAELGALQEALARNPNLSAEKRIRLETGLREKQSEAQIDAYADLAGAAKGFFNKESAGYKVLEGVETAMHLMKMAHMVEKLFFSTTSATVESAQTAFMLAEHAAAGVIDVGLTASTETAKNGLKVPGVIMSFMSWLGPWGVAAAGIAIAAVLGSSSKGGAPTVTMDAFAGQKANDGSGGVLGDARAQSKSIENSLSALEGMARPELAFTSQMVGLLRNIKDGLAGATNAILSSGFDFSGANFSGSSTSSGGGLLGAIFGKSSSSTSVSDLGLAFKKQTVAQALQAVQLQAYQVTRRDWKKSGTLGIGSKSGSDYTTSFTDVDARVSEAMTLVVKQMELAVTTAGTKLGATYQQLDAVRNVDSGLGKVSLIGKTGEEVQDLLAAVFSAMGDNMAEAAAPFIGDFQKVGEGYLETLTRVSAGLDEAALYTDKLGTAAVSFSDLRNKQGDVGAELVRQSIEQAEAKLVPSSSRFDLGGFTQSVSSVGKIINNFSGSASDIADLYTGLLNVRTALTTLGFSANAVTADLLRGAGGLDALQSGLADFTDGFLSTEEQAALKRAKMDREFGKLGLSTPTTASAFKDLVLGLRAGGEGSAELLGRVLVLSGGMRDLADAVGDTANTASDAAKRLREAVLAARTAQLSPTQSLAQRQSEFASAYSMALATTGATQAGYADKLTDVLPGLSAALMDTARTREEWALATATLFAQSEAIAQQLDAPGKTAEALIADAVTLGGERTVEGLRAVVAALTGNTIPAFALGGSHSGGLRIVGENGPELEVTGPSRIFNASQTRDMLSGGGGAELIQEVRALRAEVQGLRVEAQAIASHTNKTTRILTRVTRDGEALQTVAAT